MHVCTHACMHTHTNACTHARTCARTHTHTHVHMHVHTYAHKHIHKLAHTHTHTYAQNSYAHGNSTILLAINSLAKCAISGDNLIPLVAVPETVIARGDLTLSLSLSLSLSFSLSPSHTPKTHFTAMCCHHAVHDQSPLLTMLYPAYYLHVQAWGMIVHKS